MNTIFMNSKNGRTSDPDLLFLNLTDKKTWKEGTNMFLYQILACTIHGKI